MPYLVKQPPWGNELSFQTELSPAQLETSCVPAGGPCTRFPISTDL